jgi:hypothetical protein
MIDSSLDFAEVTKAWLNSELWDETFVAEIPVDLQPPSDPAYYTDALRCIVLPREDEYSRPTRDPKIQGDYTIDAFFAAHVDFLPAATIYGLAHSVVSRFTEMPFAIDGGFINGVRRVIWLPATLQDKRIFGTVISIDLQAR